MEDTKKKILTAAEHLISKNGLAETTIAKIARKSDIADSLVYQYFKMFLQNRVLESRDK